MAKQKSSSVPSAQALESQPSAPAINMPLNKVRGAPIVSGIPKASRTAEVRPSAPTTNRALAVTWAPAASKLTFGAAPASSVRT
jgi:hypothetical protein